MKLSRSFTLLLLLTTLVSTSCSKDSVRPSSSTGALTANSALENMVPRRFEKHMLNTAGFQTMNEFIRADVRSRADEEPVGDSDGSYDPSTVDSPASSGEPADTAGNGQPQDEQAQVEVPAGEESAPGAASDAGKFGWARKSFGEAVKRAPGANGVIVLYADENYYDLERLIAFLQDGRNRLAEQSGVDGDRIQVVFGGYRGVPQVELWVVPEGSEMPEFKPDDRTKPSESEN